MSRCVGEIVKNIEIKAKARNLAQIRELVERLPVSSREVLVQEDTFFFVENGRLKLRRFADERGELIRYERADEKGPKTCEYRISATNYPDVVLRSLSGRYAIQGVVKKMREVYIVGQMRIHLDDVEGLGNFVEFEYVLNEGQDVREGEERVNELIGILGISRDDLEDKGYIDLLLRNRE